MNIIFGIGALVLSALIMKWLADRAPDGEEMGDMGVYIRPKGDKEIE